MRKIYLSNQTEYPTGQLRRFVTRAADEVLDSQKVPRIRSFFSQLKRSRYAGVRGMGESRDCHIWIWMPRGDVCKAELALVITRSLGQVKGLTIREMRGNGRYDQQHPRWREIYSWAEQLPLEKKTKRKSKAATSVEKLEHAQRMVQKARKRIVRKEGELKKAKTILDRWITRFKSLEKRKTIVQGMVLDQTE